MITAMTRRRLGWWLAAVLLANSCSQNADHPAVIDGTQGERPGNPTGSSGKGTATAGDGANITEGGSGEPSSSEGGAPGPGHETPKPNTGASFGFDPDHLYVHGFLGDVGSANAIVDVSAPDVYTTMLDGPGIGLKVFRGHLYYLDLGDTGLHVFSPDYIGSKPWSANYDYPMNPERNDAAVPTPRCDPKDVTTFVVSPDDKHLVYRCRDENWYEDDVLVYDGPERYHIDALSYDGLFLLNSGGNLGVMSIHDVQRHTMDRAYSRVLAKRAKRGGFTYVAAEMDAPDDLALWELDDWANPTKLADYPPPPNGVSITQEYGELMADGTLFQLGQDLDDKHGHEVLVRRKPGAETSELAYRDADNPLVSLSVFQQLFTGP